MAEGWLQWSVAAFICKQFDFVVEIILVTGLI